MSGAHSLAMQPELAPPTAPDVAFEPETPITRLREQAGDFLSRMGGFFLNNRAGRLTLAAAALTGTAASSTACGEQPSDNNTQVVQEAPCQAYPLVEQRNEGNTSYPLATFKLEVQDETFQEGPGEVWAVLSQYFVDDEYESGGYTRQDLLKGSQISMDVGTMQGAQKIELFAARFDEQTFETDGVTFLGDDDFRNYAAAEPLPCGDVVIGPDGSVQVVAPGEQMEAMDDGYGGGAEATEQPPATSSPAQTPEQVPGNVEPFPFNELEDGAICSAAAPELAGNNYRFAIRAYGDRAPAAGELLYAYVNILKFGPPFSDTYYLVPLNENLEAVVEVPSGVITDADDVAAHVGQFDPANDPGTEPIINDDETLDSGQYRSPTEEAMRAGLCVGWTVLDDGTLYPYTNK